MIGWPLPLVALQILWLNLITDIFPAFALALEPSAPDVMKRPPGDPKESLLTLGFIGLIVWQGLLLTAVTLVAFGVGMHWHGTDGEGLVRASEFAKAHVPGTINVPSATLVQWAGFFADYSQPVYLLTDPKLLTENLRGLRSIAIDNVGGYFDATSVREAGLCTESYSSATPQQLRPRIDNGEVKLLDVRAATEFQEGHIAGAEYRFLGKLLREIKGINKSKPIVAQCLGGGRSAIATSILQRAGFDVTNMQGGYKA